MSVTLVAFCATCGKPYNVFMLYAYEGNTYCPICKPVDAQSMCNIHVTDINSVDESEFEQTEEEYEMAERIYNADRARIPYGWER